MTSGDYPDYIITEISQNIKKNSRHLWRLAVTCPPVENYNLKLMWTILKWVMPTKWYMHNPAPALENDTHKLLWDFNIQTDHLISARRPYLMIINKKEKICKIVDFAVPAEHRIKLKECEKRDKYLDLARELKKSMEHDGDNYTNSD